MPFSLTANWLDEPMQHPNSDAEDRARAHQLQLTKPAGALGELERLAIHLASLQGRIYPRVDACHISLFAADHGIAAAGVSAYPQAVTAQMVANFAAGGAAVSVLARLAGARFDVVNLGTLQRPEPDPRVLDRWLGPGTADFTRQAAMTVPQRDAALLAGAERVAEAQKAGCELFVAGEMGIGNTSAATALGAVLLELDPEQLVGPGTGVGAAVLARKVALIRQGLSLHTRDNPAVLELLRRLGGFEIAAMVGAYLHAGQRAVPVLVDGFISTLAALVAVRLAPGLASWLIYGHCSAEPGHRLLLEALHAKPLLTLDMRLGEGSGAALALQIVRSACELHGGMATFAQAGVAGPGA
ncbi:nicotinate-nucleotide--dimethylbenzimidazole phosphoribosyltransferase [Marinobacterium sedimentorum]|uniref:nicotinate-nucleotide--dimethylbenzimidazole phosphoribosyltransferase n=1 Tax=Marinobacterium sedimentorum TaxID=2927804 RepID=UPI0020C624E1|nr:nicotinate-nucleotide--dimethylbenzimidazole phosphoribosyltransferase [Marinobacterium sedimentorum]MCP8687922.1 nicotinate-nucleotide--dimethylbenzimidazole phosphoribosyltransferase [Marinobacterium sedimentorum]